MKIHEITEESKGRAEEIIEHYGGVMVPVYSVIKTDEDGRVMSITHDHLENVNRIDSK